MTRSQKPWAFGLGILLWLSLLFCPLAFLQTAKAEEVESYGTVIGIVGFSKHVILSAMG